jgi:hypothetical protein
MFVLEEVLYWNKAVPVEKEERSGDRSLNLKIILEEFP